MVSKTLTWISRLLVSLALVAFTNCDGSYYETISIWIQWSHIHKHWGKWIPSFNSGKCYAKNNRIGCGGLKYSVNQFWNIFGHLGQYFQASRLIYHSKAGMTGLAFWHFVILLIFNVFPQTSNFRIVCS